MLFIFFFFFCHKTLLVGHILHEAWTVEIEKKIKKTKFSLSCALFNMLELSHINTYHNW